MAYFKTLKPLIGETDRERRRMVPVGTIVEGTVQYNGNLDTVKYPVWFDPSFLTSRELAFFPGDNGIKGRRPMFVVGDHIALYQPSEEELAAARQRLNRPEVVVKHLLCD